MKIKNTLRLIQIFDILAILVINVTYTVAKYNFLIIKKKKRTTQPPNITRK